MTDIEKYNANKKPFYMALLTQILCPGLGNCYLDGKILKPIVYPSIIIVSGVGAAWISGKEEFNLQTPLIWMGFGISTCTYFIGIVDIFPSYLRYDERLKQRFNISFTPEAIKLTYEF